MIIPGRPPLWRRDASDGRGGRRTHPNTRADEARVILAARVARLQAPAGVPLLVEVVAVYPRPARRPELVPPEVWASGGRVRRLVVPDPDNVLKAVMDGLTNAGVWTDDGRSALATCSTWWAAVGEGEHTVVKVAPVGWT